MPDGEYWGGATDYPGAYDFAVVSRSAHSLAVHAHHHSWALGHLSTRSNRRGWRSSIHLRSQKAAQHSISSLFFIGLGAFVARSSTYMSSSWSLSSHASSSSSSSLSTVALRYDRAFFSPAKKARSCSRYLSAPASNLSICFIWLAGCDRFWHCYSYWWRRWSFWSVDAQLVKLRYNFFCVRALHHDVGPLEGVR